MRRIFTLFFSHRTRPASTLVWLLATLLIVGPVTAQFDADGLTRDPASLARRLLGWNGDPPIPDLPAMYEPGDTETFVIGKLGSDTPSAITATLVGATPEIYLWAEEGVAYNRSTTQQLAQLLDQIVGTLRWRGTYTPDDQLMGTRGQVFDPANQHPLPDADGDPHLHILFATDLPDDRDAVANPVDSLPDVWQPAGYGNQRELIIVNTTPFAGADLTNEVFVTAILRAAFNLIHDTSYAHQPAWLREGLSWHLLLQLQQAPVGIEQVANYLLAPQTPLLQPSTLTTRTQAYGAQLLFLSYFAQRYGERAILRLFSSQGEGMEPLDTTLEALDIVDPLTGAHVTGDEAFADFVMTNAINGLFGDGRYAHRLARLEPGQVAPAQTIQRLPITLSGDATPYGVYYYAYQTAQPATVEVTLTSDTTIERLNLSNSDTVDNRFYWSGRAPDRDHTLTRAFDLTDVETATLTYDVWYDLADSWNYGYLEVSSDGGETWQVVRARHSSDRNRNGAAYGPGYTGISNPDGPRPFPVIGIQIADDGVTIVAVEPDGPGAQAGLEAGDVIAGYDGGPWPAPPNVLGLLSGRAPGDTLDLWIQRGQEQIDVPVVLGASPTRVVQPEPRWLPERVDLSAYAGKTILIRFEYVSLPGRWNEGFAVDNIAIPELGYTDEADGETDWSLAGWELVDNALPARWLVQAATFGATGEPPRVRRLLSPGETSSGSWVVPLHEGERLLLAVSAMNADTAASAPFELTLRDISGDSND